MALTERPFPLWSRGDGKARTGLLVACEMATHGKRVVVYTPDVEKTKEQVNEICNGVWPIGLKVKEFK